MHRFDETGQRYIVSDPPSHGSRSICNSCNRIHFQAIYDIDPDSIAATEWYVVYELNLRNNSSFKCELCSTFNAYLLECVAETDDPWALDAKPGNACIAVKRESNLDGTPRLALGIGQHTPTGLIPPGIELMALPLPKANGDRSTTLEDDREYQTRTEIDYSWLTSSLSRCAQNHDHGTKVTDLHDMWLIDCQIRSVITAPPAAIYLALSYVWGKPAGGPPSSAGPGTYLSPGVLPRLIEDAIAATISMGLHYLWVDQLCIDQTSPPRKQRQIQAMGNVYSGAFATILGLGPDSDSGLFGISVARKPLSGLRAGGAVFFPMESEDLTATNEMIEASLWNRRGWTFQEGLLSKRLIFFSPSRVMVMCDKATMSEPDPGCCPRGKYWETPKSFELRQRLWKVHFERDVVSYAARALTYPADGLDAFRGYLSNFAPWTQWGTPLESHTTDTTVRSPCHHFTSWLLWLVDNGLRSQISRPNAKLPTWSWVTSRNISIPEQYPPHLARCMAQQLFFERGDGSLISITDLLAAYHQHNKHLPEESRFIHVAAPKLSLRVDLSAWGTSDYEFQASNNCYLTWPFNSSQLQFRLWFSPDHKQHPIVEQSSYDCAFLILERGQRSSDFPWCFCGIVVEENNGDYVRLGFLQAFVEWRKTPADSNDKGGAPLSTFDVREGEEVYTTKQDGLTTLVSSHEADQRFEIAVRETLESVEHALVRLG